MTSINKLDRSLTTLRKILSERAATRGAGTERSEARNVNATAGNEGAKQVKLRIKNRLADLDLTQPQQQERAATIFLGTVLANEFGNELLDDPAFHDLLADVRSAMLGDAETQKNLLAMLNELKDSDQV